MGYVLIIDGDSETIKSCYDHASQSKCIKYKNKSIQRIVFDNVSFENFVNDYKNHLQNFTTFANEVVFNKSDYSIINLFPNVESVLIKFEGEFDINVFNNIENIKSLDIENLDRNNKILVKINSSILIKKIQLTNINVFIKSTQRYENIKIFRGKTIIKNSIIEKLYISDSTYSCGLKVLNSTIDKLETPYRLNKIELVNLKSIIIDIDCIRLIINNIRTKGLYAGFKKINGLREFFTIKDLQVPDKFKFATKRHKK